MAKIKELVTHWDDKPGESFLVEREEQFYTPAAQGGRGIRKIQPFKEYFPPGFVTGKDVSGKPPEGGKLPSIAKPPMVYENEDVRIEVANLDGPQHVCHRGCDNDELWFQVDGTSVNHTEMGTVELGPMEMALVPAGVAHRIIGSPNFKRLIIYTKKPLRLVSPAGQAQAGKK